MNHCNNTFTHSPHIQIPNMPNSLFFEILKSDCLKSCCVITNAQVNINLQHPILDPLYVYDNSNLNSNEVYVCSHTE